jgi:hypothetical protein
MADTIALLFATATERFTRNVGQPTDNNIFCICEVLMPPLHNLDYNMQCAVKANAHNLVGLIQETASYTA